MKVDIPIEFILWRLIKKIVMKRAGPKISIYEWILEAIDEKILREPTYIAKNSKNLFKAIKMEHKVKTTNEYFKFFKESFKGVVIDHGKRGDKTVLVRRDCGCEKWINEYWLETVGHARCCHNHHTCCMHKQCC